MFTPARYIVIDDEIKELRVLVEALHGIGAPCVGLHYTGRALDPTIFAGVRILFCDLHLLPGGNVRTQHAAIESQVRSNIDPATSGSYLLVLWTKHDEEVAEFTNFLGERLAPDKKPLAVIGLDKALYIVPGEPTKTSELMNAVREKIAAFPQLLALLSWEIDVLAASRPPLAEVTELVPWEKGGAGEFAAELDRVLSRLAVAAVGAPNVGRDRRGAINTALAPILADRILNAPARTQDEEIWREAITREWDSPEMDEVQIGRMNRMLHLSVPPAEIVGPTDWGAVLRGPDEEQADRPMLQRFGVKYHELMSQVFHIDRADRSRCVAVLVRIGAVCDYAQQKSGPIPYVLGLLVPTNIVRRRATRLESELGLPVFLIDKDQGPVWLFVNARFQISMVQPPEGWTPLFRIREQALIVIASHSAAYTTRPGIVKFPG